MSVNLIRHDISTEQQFPGIYDGLDSSSANFIEAILFERYSLGMPTTYEYLKEMVDDMKNEKYDNEIAQ